MTSRALLAKPKGVTDPERKRKIVANEFIKVFEGIEMISTTSG